MKRKLLEVSKLNVTFKTLYGVVQAVRGVDLSIYSHEFVGIVGESGCGKSVMTKAIMRLLDENSAHITAKSIQFSGQNLLEISEKEMRKVRGGKIGIIFQDPMTSLNPTMQVGDQILEGVRLHKKGLSKQEAYNRVLDLLKLVKIPDPKRAYSSYPHEMSGGMRQRIMIAIAIAPSPDLIIADEPTTALDVTVQAQILELLTDIQEQTGTSIILITHDLSIVANRCSRIYVMYAGQVVEKTTQDELFSAPAHPYTRSLIDSIPHTGIDKTTRLNPIPGKPPNLLKPPQGCAFCKRCPKAMHICGTGAPPQFELKDGQNVACWLYDSRCSEEKHV